MKVAWLASVALIVGCGGKPAPGPAPRTAAANAGFWDVLAVPESRWVLHDSMSKDDPPPELVIRVAAVRTLGDARVVRFTGSVRYRADGEPEPVTGAQSLGAQWAVTPQGLWMLDGDADDAAIDAAVAGPPHWASPPAEVDPPTGRYMHVLT